MHVAVVVINLGTTNLMDLMLRSFYAHHRSSRHKISLLLYDNDTADIGQLGWTAAMGVEIRQTGYTAADNSGQIYNHGEVLRDVVLAEPEYDAYLFLDTDTCFVRDNTVDALVDDLEADDRLFAVQATWLDQAGELFEELPGGIDPATGTVPYTWIREAWSRSADGPWSTPGSYRVEFGERVHSFCVLVRNDNVFRSIVSAVGLSAARTYEIRGGRWWDTLGLLTQVMKTHGRTWRVCETGVIHFGGGSYKDWARAELDRTCARMLEQYEVPRPEAWK
ncbi:hypothetical protein ACWGID_04215 [Kribbella sp. NPDC054772]